MWATPAASPGRPPAATMTADRALHRSRAMMTSVKQRRFSMARGVRPRLGTATLGALIALALLHVAPEAMAQGGSNLPQLPGQGGSDGATPSVRGASAAGSNTAPPVAGPEGIDIRKLYEHLRRGVVAVERNGVPTAVGTVLGGDGRVLTALSALGGADAVDVRYADGTAVHAKVGESDTGLDLALLIPKSAKWREGLSASEADPTGAMLRAMLPAAMKGGGFGPAIAGVRGLAEAHSRDGQALLDLLDVDLKGAPIAGAPLLDANGGVVAVLVRACKGAAAEGGDVGGANGCVPVVLGAPVTALRSFLSHAPTAAVVPAVPAAPAPWLGIRGEPETDGNVRGVRVTAVAPSSPAEKAGLKAASDVIVAVDGKPIDTPEKLAEAIGKHSPGDSVKLLVFGGDKFREPSVALRAAP
jgi:serine protease Do